MFSYDFHIITWNPGCLDACGTSLGFDRFRIDRAGARGGGGGTSVVEPVGFVEDFKVLVYYTILYISYLYLHIYIYHICILRGVGIHIGVSKCVAKITSGTLKREVSFVSGGVHVNFR